MRLGTAVGKRRAVGAQGRGKARREAGCCVGYVWQIALLAFAFPGNQRRCPEHEADGKHTKIDDNK